MRFPLATATWDGNEVEALHRVIKTGNYTMGAEVTQFEKDFAAKFNTSHAVMSNSGSSANLLAVAAIKYSSHAPSPQRDEVVVPAVSWSTSFYPLSQMGFKLRFIDVDLSTLNAKPEDIEAAISQKTAGILVVNLLGNPSCLREIREIADNHGIFMIEDNCESMGAIYEGKPSGTFGDVGTFSSFFSHHISTMEGGVSVTDSEELRQVMTSLRSHGWTRELPEKNFVHDKTGTPFDDLFRFVLPGYNLRPVEMEGAVGQEQLKKLNAIVEGRRRNALKFKELMGRFPEIQTQVENGTSSWFGFSMILTGGLEGRRPELIQALTESGVAVRPIVAGNFARNPVLQHLPHCPLPDLTQANKIHDHGLFIGNHHYELVDEFVALEEAIETFLG